MSHSFKLFPTGACCCCKSQHRVKKKAFRRFRSKVNTLIRQQKFGKLPFKSIELTSSWNLGGDGKMFYGFFDPTTNIYRGRKRRYLLEPPLWWEKQRENSMSFYYKIHKSSVKEICGFCVFITTILPQHHLFYRKTHETDTAIATFSVRLF